MKLRKSMCVVWAVLSGGCAHLEQAPLVYSSKTSLGLDVSSASTENPGIAMNLGYKQIDAAYVPVAVARACRDATRECEGTAYELKVISGSSRRGSSDGDGGGDLGESQRTELAMQALDRYEKALGEFNTVTAQLERARADVIVLQGKHDELVRQKQAHEARPADAAVAQGDAAAQAVADWNDEKEDSLVAAAASLEQRKRERDSAEVDYQSRKAGVNAAKLRLVAAKASISQSDRGDAYSVFGSFRAENDTKAGGLSVGLGKVFSTGVASQNLSEGVAISMCYGAVAKLASASGLTAEQVTKLLEDCRNRLSVR